MQFLAHKAEDKMLSELFFFCISQGLFVAQFPAMHKHPLNKNNEDHQADAFEAQQNARGLDFAEHDRMTKQC